MKIYKFGGSILATASSRDIAIKLLQEQKEERIIVVCSAMGRNGFPYATDTFKNLIHENTLQDKEMARLLSMGENISALLFTSECRKNNLHAICLSVHQLGIITDHNYLDASVLKIDSQYLKMALKQYQVVVIPGFVGENEEKEITVLGRGGSDLSAVLIAEALEEKEVYLWKDVDGIYPSYPLIGKSLLPYDALNYEEMKQLIALGYNIIQDKAIIWAQKADIRIHLRHYLHPDQGTDIYKRPSTKECIGLFSNNHEIRLASFRPDEVFSHIQELLKTQHIFLKDYVIGHNQVVIYLPSSQISVARKLILNLYWNSKEKPSSEKSNISKSQQ